ncbi:MAG TPA: SDR family oxidoreductase [Candidatus Binatia bacterium]|jgi:NAD(P)-dependent dehydrogenase (short-subunit alcohol dehydrogenase family)
MARVGAASSARLAERVALVTGTAGGGRAVAQTLANAGANVIAVDVGKKRSGNLRTVAADVTEESSVAALVRRCLDEFGQIDILVNTACAILPARLEKITEAAWQLAMRSNLISAFLCSKAVVPSMLERGSGRILNLIVAEALTGAKNSAHYAAAAGGMLGFSKSLALELAPHNITVNTICPDPYAAPRKRFPHAAFAGAAVFLAGDEAAYVTGQTLFVDGQSVHGLANT